MPHCSILHKEIWYIRASLLKMWSCLTVDPTVFVTLSSVYACLYHSLHASLLIPACAFLWFMDCLGLEAFDFGNWCIWCSLREISPWREAVCVSVTCSFWGRWTFVLGFGVVCLCCLSLCVLWWFGIVCQCVFVFFFCCDYYGMQLAAEPLPVYCSYPVLGIITDITRLFTMWEPRWAIFTECV